MRRLSGALVLVALGVTGLRAQAPAPAPAFEVASVKRTVSNAFPTSPEARAGGAFVAANVTLASILRFAYRVEEFQVIHGPDWLRRDRFDVEAREMAVYALVHAQTGAPGPTCARRPPGAMRQGAAGRPSRRRGRRTAGW